MQKLSGGHYFTKIDLADAYNQIKLTPESQKRLALSTHQKVLPDPPAFWNQFSTGLLSGDYGPAHQ